MEKENAPPEQKKRRLSLSLKKREDHFGSVSETELEEKAQFKTPKNSAQASKWAMKNLGDWVKDHNRKNSNHSLRVMGATTLFAAGVPERVIQSRTGHSSLDALRKYERVYEKQEEAISKILTGTSENHDKAVLQDSSRELKSEKPTTSVVYKDCVVNMYSSPSSFLPPFPAQYPQYPCYLPYPPYYPSYHQ